MTYPDRPAHEPAFNAPWPSIVLPIALVAAFLVQYWVLPAQEAARLALTSQAVLREGRLDTLFTHIFLHGGWTHLFMNVGSALAFGPPVQLRRPTRPRSLTAGQPAELGGQQPVGHEPVEVERGNRPRNTHRRGGLILADGLAPLHDEPVQGPPLRLGQRGHTGDAFVEVVAGHGRLSPSVRHTSGRRAAVSRSATSAQLTTCHTASKKSPLATRRASESRRRCPADR